MRDQTVGEVMTKNVVYLPAETTIEEATRAMRDRNIGDVVVTEGPTLAGVVTDRDIVVRAIAEHMDPATTTIGTITSRDMIMVQEDASVAEATTMMRDRAVRRLLVCDRDRQLVGIVTIGDIAMEMDSESALADISAAPPNK
jgi:CBS domain-containing protein